MKSILAKEVRNQFESSLKRRIQNVSRMRFDSGLPGSLAWNVGYINNSFAFLILAISPRDDRFTVEIAIASEKVIPHAIGNSTEFTPKMKTIRFRISRLWQPNGFETWYDLQYDCDYPDAGPYSLMAPIELSIQRIPVKVERAINAIDAFGLAYFERTIGLKL